MENSPILSMLIGLMGLVFVVYYFNKNGFKLNLNIVNFMFLFAGIILHGTPRRFLDAITSATKGSAGIILQFPFYAGIMGMMVGANAAGVSCAGLMSNWFVNISTVTTFPFFAFLSAGLVNFFVPSGGGQWAVQAPIMMPAGAALGVSAAKTAMAIAWGDAWTNMIQPFWALPALGIAGLGARDIMGFCLIVMLYSGVIISLGLILL
jgi:short-chain fatty acids transporter